MKTEGSDHIRWSNVTQLPKRQTKYWNIIIKNIVIVKL